MALKSDGTVWVFGQDFNGMFGNGQSSEVDLTPVMIQGLNGVVATSSGIYHSIFLKDDGSIWECGSDTNGQMGDSSIIGAYIQHLPIVVGGVPLGDFINRPVEILGPNMGTPSTINTAQTSNSSLPIITMNNTSTMVNISTTPAHNNILSNIVMAVCALILIVGCIIYFGVIRKM
jgi:hypothetical protein